MINGVSTKESILKAAETMFSIKGFSDTKISEISGAVGVSDSTLYEHFENKEDILFTIPREKTLKLIDINERHLRGLRGENVKLRKLIWNYMEFLVDNRDYTSLLLFELRSNRDFYETRNYQLIREFTRPYREVIVRGQSEGKFRPDISPSLILNLIFGTIDLVLITWLLENNPRDPLALFDDLLDLLEHGIQGREPDLEFKKDKKRVILQAAAKTFSQHGYKKTRIQDIATLAKVADATIYKYFASKEEILFSLPIEHTKELLSIQREHLNGLKATDLKLSILIKDYLNFVDSHRNYSSICFFDLRYNKLFYQTEAYDLFRKFSRAFFDIIVEGIKTNHFRAAINPYIATKMIFGVIDHVILSWIKFGRPNRASNLSDQICNVTLGSLQA